MYQAVLIQAICALLFSQFWQIYGFPAASSYVAYPQCRVNRRAAQVSERLTGWISIASAIMHSKIITIII